MDYLIIYLEIVALTLIYTTVLFVNVRSEMGNDREVKIFRAFLLTMIVALVADSFTQAQYRGFLHMPASLVAFLYSFYMFMFSGVLPFLWFIFVEMRLGGRLLKNRRNIAISLIPLLVMSFMCFASMKTGWFFSVNEFGIYTRGKLWSLMTIVNYTYFLFTTIHALMVASREPSSLKRKQYYVLAMFLIAPFIGGLLQLFIGNHPFVAPATSIAMLFIFINIQGNLIHNDSMTGVYNRKSAEKYIEELKARATETDPFYLYKIGVDGFKEINDTYGYLEGDKMLKIVATELKKLANEYAGFVARLGGVEFLVGIEGRNVNNPDDFTAAVMKAMTEETKRLELPYELKTSCGYTVCDSPEINTDILISDADKEMYHSKDSDAVTADA